VSASEVKEYFSNLKETLENGGQPVLSENIYNYDETNMRRPWDKEMYIQERF